MLTVLGSYRIGRGWELGMRYRLASGYMYTPNAYGFYDENVGTYLPLSSYPTYGSRLAALSLARHPRRQDLDLSLGKDQRVPRRLNVYNQGNVDGITYDYNYTHMAYANDLPIIPNMGLRVEH